MRIVAPDAVYVQERGRPVAGAREIAAAYNRILKTQDVEELSLKQSDIRVLGDIAVEDGAYAQTLSKNGKTERSSGKYTIVWKQNGRGWQLWRLVWGC